MSACPKFIRTSIIYTYCYSSKSKIDEKIGCPDLTYDTKPYSKWQIDSPQTNFSLALYFLYVIKKWWINFLTIFYTLLEIDSLGTDF